MLNHKIKYYLYTLIKNIKFPLVKKRLLIVRLDSIGDYILFRNSIELIAKSEKYKSYEIYFLCNHIYRILVSNLDSQYLKRIIIVNPNIISSKYSIKKSLLLLKIKFYRFETIINPVHSRVFKIDEFILDVNSPIRIGSLGDDVNMENEIQYELSNSCYTNLINVPNCYTFEFFRNQIFISKLLNIDKNYLRLKLNTFNNDFNTCGFYILFSISAGSNKRKWSYENFAGLIELISNFYPNKFEFILVGTENDYEGSKNIVDLNRNIKIKNLVGKTTLPELITLINNTCLLISNESSSVHIAASLGTKCVCVSNGNHYGRFNPYPVSISSKIYTIYPWGVNAYEDLINDLVYKFKKGSNLDINLIKSKDVFNMIINLQIL